MIALAYAAISLLIEAVAIVVGHLRVPADNATLAPIVLLVPPAVTALMCGYRTAASFVLVALLLGGLTLVITAVVTRLTGLSTGLVEPLCNRLAAGWLAAVLANRLTPVTS